MFLFDTDTMKYCAAFRRGLHSVRTPEFWGVESSSSEGSHALDEFRELYSRSRHDAGQKSSSRHYLEITFKLFQFVWLVEREEENRRSSSLIRYWILK